MSTDTTPEETSPLEFAGSGFVQLPREVLFDGRLSHGARLVYAVLVSRHFDDKPIDISHVRIAELLAFSGKEGHRNVEDVPRVISAEYNARTSMKWMKELISFGYVTVAHRRKGLRNLYHLTSAKGGTTTKGGSTQPLPRPALDHYQGRYGSTTKGGTLSKLRSRTISRKAYVTNNELDNRLIQMRMQETGQSHLIIAQDLRRAVGSVGLHNQATLVQQYRYAIDQRKDNPLGWAISETKRMAQ